MKSAKCDIKRWAQGLRPLGTFLPAHARGGISRWNPDRLLRSAGDA